MDWGEGREQKTSLEMAAIFHMPFLFTDESLSGKRSDCPAAVWEQDKTWHGGGRVRCELTVWFSLILGE